MTGRAGALCGAILFCALLLGVHVSADPAADPRAAEARAMAGRLAAELRQALGRALERGGPAAALQVCADRAQVLTARIARRSGWSVRRVSLRERNPQDRPDAWEARVLRKFEAARGQGRPAAKLEYWEEVTQADRTYFRYMRAIPAGPACMPCHGPTDRIAPEIKRLLSREYPHDRATGCLPGGIRGAFSLRIPVPAGRSPSPGEGDKP